VKIEEYTLFNILFIYLLFIFLLLVFVFLPDGSTVAHAVSESPIIFASIVTTPHIIKPKRTKSQQDSNTDYDDSSDSDEEQIEPSSIRPDATQKSNENIDPIILLPSNETCIVIIDSGGKLSIYTLMDLKFVCSYPLATSATFSYDFPFSMTNDGRLTYFPTPLSLSHSILFSSQSYDQSICAPSLWPPSIATQDAAAEPTIAIPTQTKGFFSSIFGGTGPTHLSLCKD
jgi:hypothetical protein